MDRQHADFLLLLIGSKFPALTKANKIVDIVPVFDHVLKLLEFHAATPTSRGSTGNS
jgi:hypothetical protein